MENSLNNVKEPHPWGEFLKIRVKVIHWMHQEMGYDDERIAYALSMDTEQVYLIRNLNPNGEKYDSI